MACEKEAVKTVLIEIVEDLVQDWGLDLDGPINGETRLVNDLNFASVDIIQLCVAVEEHYGRKMKFQDLLMQDGSYLRDLGLSRMGAFVAERLEEHTE